MLNMSTSSDIFTEIYHLGGAMHSHKMEEPHQEYILSIKKCGNTNKLIMSHWCDIFKSEKVASCLSIE